MAAQAPPSQMFCTMALTFSSRRWNQILLFISRGCSQWLGRMQHKHCYGTSKASLISSLTASAWTSWWPEYLLLAGSTRLQREAYMRGNQGLLAELPFNSLLSTASHLREPFGMSSPAGHSGCGPSWQRIQPTPWGIPRENHEAEPRSNHRTSER